MTATPADRVRVLGVRHHGPGSARAVASALAAFDPDVVLIEGPPEADALIPWVAQGLRPPVALMAYETASPASSALWPLALFSPEWQAIVWAVEHKREVRFCDLPATNVLAVRSDEASAAPAAVRTDPIAVLAHTAGYDDPERWWEDVVEARSSGDVFDAVTEAMAALRETLPPEPDPADRLNEEQREAQMRQVLRGALRDHERVAVICGAWHAPALSGKLPAAAADQRLLRGLPKVKVSLAWVPWTHSRLSFRSGYGAGIDSPGWYAHLFSHPEQTLERWFTEVAGVLRRHDLPVSSAHAIEATRLAQTLATMRGRPLAGLDEVQEAALAVMCEGSAASLRFVTDDLVIGEELGEVPAQAPLVPLDADLRQQSKSLRLAMSATSKDVILDLRKDTDRAKSRLLRRLGVLAIGWGTPMEISGTGTFKEAWRVLWQPEFAVAIVLASAYGTTVSSAATRVLLEEPGTIADVTRRVEQALLCELPATLPPLLAALDDRAAHEADIAHLMDALPALIRAQRYGDVRGTDTSSLGTVARAMLTRVCAGLGAAVSGLSPEGAGEIRRHVDSVHDVVALLGDDARAEWLTALRSVLGRADLPGLLAGRLARLLLDAGDLPSEDAGERLSRALSHGPTVAERAAYAEGFLAGSALLLIHDRRILGTVDAWLRSLSDDSFTDTLPVLRRAFGSYNAPERRAIAERAAAVDAPGESSPTQATFDLDGLEDILATVGLLLFGRQGVSNDV